MVVREDGTKWACQSCLKGHRVSGCNHTDRELTLVPKKGRPVTQCQHCRLERKKRSAHVKCDCGEAEKPHHPKEKCIHLREAEERAKAGFHEDHHKQTEDDPAHLTAVAEEQGCCCHHGGKCSCSLVKKESQNKGTSPPHGPAVQKPRLETTKSDGSITVFANGHHKPVHRKNHAAHECGMPYKMPMPRSYTEHNVAQAARRSVDSLPLNLPFNSAAFASQNTKTFAAERRLSKSEQPSPKITGCNGGLSDAQLSSVDFSSLGPIQTNQSLDSAVSDSAAFPSFEPMSGVADGSFDPWSAFPSADSMPNNNPFGAWPTVFDTSNVPQPALTAASSGTQSEVDEIPAMEDLYSFQMPSIQEDIGSFNLDPVSNDGNNNRRSLPPNFFGNADFSLPDMTNEWQTPVGSVHGSDEGKSKALNGDQAIALPDAWSTPTMPAMTSIAQRSSGTSSSAGRPQSQSVGPGSAPSDDLIRQLFPDIDINNSAFATGNSPSAMGYAAAKRMGGLPLGNSTSAAPGTDASGFTSQPWNDGSLVVPNDDFGNTYGMDTEFSSPGFNDGWPYQ